MCLYIKRRERGSSPRTWGCFYREVGESPRRGVFPTHVGVFLKAGEKHPHGLGLPHARGGVSTDFACARPESTVFPTHVGVFLAFGAGQVPGDGLPHARGGVSRVVSV